MSLAENIKYVEVHLESLAERISILSEYIERLANKVKQYNSYINSYEDVMYWSEFKQNLESINHELVEYNAPLSLYNCDNDPTNPISLKNACKSMIATFTCYTNNDNMSYAFYKMSYYSTSSLTSLTINMTVTSDKMSLRSIFAYNKYLAYIDFQLNLTKNLTITNADSMFYENESLTNLTFEINKNDHTLTVSPSCKSILYGCEKLSSVNIDDIIVSNNSNIKDISHLFYRNHALISYTNELSDEEYKINLSNWRLVSSGFENINGLFDLCSSIQILDLSGWNVSSVTDFSYIFSCMYNLKELNIADWKLSITDDGGNVKLNVKNMFYYTGSHYVNKVSDIFTLIAHGHSINQLVHSESSEYGNQITLLYLDDSLPVTFDEKNVRLNCRIEYESNLSSVTKVVIYTYSYLS